MSKRKNKKHRLFWHFARLQIFLLLCVLGAVGYYYMSGYGAEIDQMRMEAAQICAKTTAESFRQNETSIIYDGRGNILSKLKTDRDVYYLEYSRIPADVVSAIVTIEDKKFYQHKGVDYKAIVRAGIAYVKKQKITQGASTITQQLARNIYLTQEKTWQRKVKEIFISMGMEKKFTKNQILEFYLNNIYFGNGYYGIEAASRGYFNTGVENLNLSQIAFLCGIPNNPTIYDPVTNMPNAIKRRDRILTQMYQDGKISIGAMKLAKAESIDLNRPQKIEKNDYAETYAYYCAVRKLMEIQGFEFQNKFETETEELAYEKAYEEEYNECQRKLYSGGYRIYTSLDQEVQAELQASVDQNLAGYQEVNEEGVYKLQSAGVCIDNRTGHVIAIVGGRKQEMAGYTLNRAFQSFRQPGSSIKPLIVYTPMLERGYTPDSMVNDTPLDGGPENAGSAYAGEVTLRYAVEKSRNVVAWRLFEELTPKAGLDYLKNMNFAKLTVEDERLPSALGGLTQGASPVEMTSGFAALENDGKYRDPSCVTMITEADGTGLYVWQQNEQEVYKENAARMMTDVLTGVLTEGTAAGMGLGDMPCAGKTGTTNDNKDGWFVGYTKYYTTGVWVGYDMPKELPGLTGSSYPCEIWHDFMMQLHEGLEPAAFLAYQRDDLPSQNMMQEEIQQPQEMQPQEIQQEEMPTEEAPAEEVPQPEEAPVGGSQPAEEVQPQEPVEENDEEENDEEEDEEEEDESDDTSEDDEEDVEFSLDDQ